MQKTKKRLYILAVLLSALALVFAGRLGTFDPIAERYNDRKLNEQPNEQPNEVAAEEKNITEPKLSQVGYADGNSSATVPQGASPSEDKPKQEDEILKLKRSIVSIVRSEKEQAKDLNGEDIKSMVKKAVSLAGGLDSILRDGQTVVIKPNLVQKHNDVTGELFAKEINGITTDWRVTAAVVEMVRELNPNGTVYVMEGSAGDMTAETMEYFKYTHEYIKGVNEFIAIEKDSGGWKDYSSPGVVKVDLPGGLLHKEYWLNKKYKEADVLISIPCIKTNSGTVVTGGIKNTSIGATPANLYGRGTDDPSRVPMVSHSFKTQDLQKWIHDYYMCKPVNFVIFDGLEGFQNGPVPISKESQIKDKMNMRLIMASKDPVAADTVEALVCGWDPQSIEYLKYLNQAGMGNLDTAMITVAGNYVDDVRKSFSTRLEGAPGIKVTDKVPPEFSVTVAKNEGRNIELSIAGKDAVKAEIYIEEKLYETVLPDSFGSIKIKLGKENISSVKVNVYDRFMNHGEDEKSL